MLQKTLDWGLCIDAPCRGTHVTQNLLDTNIEAHDNVESILDLLKKHWILD